MILTYHVTEQSWGKPKLEICWQGKDRRKKKKRQGGAIRVGGNKKRERERQASFRNRGREKERTPGSKTDSTVQHFCIFSFPPEEIPALSFYWQTCRYRLFSQKLTRGSWNPAVSSLPSRVVSLVMDCFSVRYVSSLGIEVHIQMKSQLWGEDFFFQI